MYSGENQNFEAHKFLTFSQKKPLGDHHCWDPAEGKHVECPLHKKLRESVCMCRNIEFLVTLIFDFQITFTHAYTVYYCICIPTILMCMYLCYDA